MSSTTVTLSTVIPTAEKSPSTSVSYYAWIAKPGGAVDNDVDGNVSGSYGNRRTEMMILLRILYHLLEKLIIITYLYTIPTVSGHSL